MANLQEEIVWVDGIYQLEMEDEVMGGADGIDNKQAKQLASRTQYLKAQLETRAAADHHHDERYAARIHEHAEYATRSDVASNAIPVGTVLACASQVAPAGFLPCEGAAISRESYANLFAAIGISYGNGDGSTTFNLPDYRGQFLRGWDNGAGVDPDAAGRTGGDGTPGDAVGTKQSDQSNNIRTFQTKYTPGLGAVMPIEISDDGSWSAGALSGSDAGHNDRVQLKMRTGGIETRPKNISVLFIIKY